MPTTLRDARNRDLAKIHIAKKELNLDEQAYRATVAGVMDEMGIPFGAGKPSSANLTPKGRALLLKTFRRMGWQGPPRPPRREAKNRHRSNGRPGMATHKQCAYIAHLEGALAWTANPSRLAGFIERQLGRRCAVFALTNREASKVITGLEKIEKQSDQPPRPAA